MFGLRLVQLDEHTGELLRDARGELLECRNDEPGELLVRARRTGLGVYHGYLDQAATSARLVRARSGALLFRTGDVLRRDRDGYYYFVERRGDSYRFRGENVAVAQVEQELSSLAGVVAAIVTGVTLPGYDGQLGLAAVVCEQGFDVQSLSALARRLPRSALPRFVRFMAELPRTSSLKLKRKSLQAQGVDPEQVTDELWVLAGRVYTRLDAEAYRDVASGVLRL